MYSFKNKVKDWSLHHPFLTILLVSALAVVINCYPVIFCGKSYVSPTCVSTLVYGWWPSASGMPPTTTYVPQHGSDAGATMWWMVPLGFIESRSLLEQGEIPLWNRYSHAGNTLIGQAVSQLGDPLQLIVILGRGSAVAWDIKYLTAKFIFCVGFGLLILRLFKSLGLSLIFTAFAAYCGAFFYIANHPVFFVFCYAPWILLSALALLDLSSKHYLGWGLVWLAANIGCFNGGHVEVSVDLIGGLNLAAVTYALIVGRNAAGRAKVISRMATATLLFLGLTAPVWLSFISALDGAYTVHQEVKVVQLPFTALPRIFDDLFYPFLTSDYASLASPTAGLLALLGCVLSVVRWKLWRREPFFWINIGAIGLWSGCVFGWVPAFVLASIPLLNRVGHVFVDFSYLVVIHLMIQSAYGFYSLTRQRVENFNRRHPSVCMLALSLASFMFFYSLFHFGLYSFGNAQWMLTPGPRVALDGFSPAINRIKTDQSGPFRVTPLHLSFSGDYLAVYGLEDIRSSEPVSNGEYIQLISKFPGMRFDDDWIIQVEDMLQAQPLLNLLNVKYLLANPTNQAPAAADFRVADRSDFLVMENLEAWPRAFFTDKVAVIPSNEEFIKHLLKNGRQPFVALTPKEMAKQPGLQQLEEAGPATVLAATNYQLLPNSTAFYVHATSAGVVCLTEGQAKDFTATANNTPKQVLTVNRAFKGIYLDQPGDYHIKFTYRPRYWRLVCILFWMAAGSVIALAVLSVAKIRRPSGMAGLHHE